MADDDNPFLPGIAGQWRLCTDCSPWDYPACSDCVRVDGAGAAPGVDAAAATPTSPPTAPAAYATEAEQTAAKAASVLVVADAKRGYAAAMDEKNATVAPGSWPGTAFPPSCVDAAPFGGGAAVAVALGLAEQHGLKAPILTARGGVAAALFAVQCIVCAAAGDSRTAKEASGLLPPGHESWGEPGRRWTTANTPSDPGYELGKQVIDGIVALQGCAAVANLGALVGQLGARVFAAIPQGGGGGGDGGGVGRPVVVTEVNAKPTQGLGFEAAGGGVLAGKDNGDEIPLADWSPEMHREINGAAAKLKAGAFGDPSTFHAVGRGDLGAIMDAIEDKYIVPAKYLIVLGINRFEAFHAKGLQVALAAGGDAGAYQAGPLKTDDRVDAKCLPGGDYHSYDDADKPTCKRVLDMLRASILCKSHAMLQRAYANALEIFGDPAVVKDRRAKVQHDVLLVFQVEGFWVELQLHFEDLVAVKTLAHAVFEIQRLNTDNGAVVASGLDTVVYVPSSFDPSFNTAERVKVLVHV